MNLSKSGIISVVDIAVLRTASQLCWLVGRLVGQVFVQDAETY